MGSIVLLDEHTINKIAAGEVVDRPSSIVKELVENSIDAGATSINVEIKNGGIKYIKIVDNGKGFASDDIEIAFERHATSKIRKEEDLLKITSMGFRGEALASIAAIAKVDLVTMNVDEKKGMHAIVEAGNILSIEEGPANIGTKIEIRDVFFNVPARFKFLKKDYTEAGYIEDVVTRAALANPGISFKYTNNGKLIIKTSGSGNLRSTIYDIFGKDIYENVTNIDSEIGDIKVSGMIGLPVISRSTRMHQFTFINKRYIKDKTITSAIDRACAEKYAINKYPFIILNININPAHIDVNVHPAKLEVKFDDEQKVFNAIYTAVRSAIEKNNKDSSPFTQARIINEKEKINQISKDIKNNGMLGNYSNNVPKKFDFDIATKKFENKEENTEKDEKENIDTNINQDQKEVENKIYENDLNSLVNDNFSYINENNNLENTYETESTNIYNENNSVNNVDNIEKNYINNNEDVEKVSNEKDSAFKFTDVPIQKYDEIDVVPQKQIKPYKYIGNVFDTYIIIQIEDKVYFVDQHAAHERYLYEQIKEAYYSKDRESQLLLLPILVDLSEKEKNIVDENSEMFKKSGFIIEEFGERTVKISGVPNIGYEIDYKSMFKDLIDDLMGASKTEKDEKEHRFLATLACKAAVKGNMKLDVKEQTSLIDNMINLENPFTCPHGRPTAISFTRYEIEKKMLRKQ